MSDRVEAWLGFGKKISDQTLEDKLEDEGFDREWLECCTVFDLQSGLW